MNDEFSALETALRQLDDTSRKFDEDNLQVLQSMLTAASKCLSLTETLCRAIQPPAPVAHTMKNGGRNILFQPRGIALTCTDDGVDRMHVMQKDRHDTARVECYAMTNSAHGYVHSDALSFPDRLQRGTRPNAASSLPPTVIGCVCLTSRADSLYYCSQNRNAICVRRANDAAGNDTIRFLVPSIGEDWPTHIAAHAGTTSTDSTVAISVVPTSGACRIMVVSIATHCTCCPVVNRVCIMDTAASAGVAFDVNGVLYAVADGRLIKIHMEADASGARSEFLNVDRRLPNPAGIVFCRDHVAMIAEYNSGRVVCVDVRTSCVVSDVTFPWKLTGHMAVHSSGSVYATTLDATTPIVDIT
jgi:hypothetical protein